jgi:putative SOS response-associated peptidase YedK
MCGRYAITTAPEAIRRLFGYPEQPNFPARYNVAPTQPIPIVRLEAGTRHFALVRWGLLPSWVKDPKTFTLLINARGESALDKPAFRNAMRRRRCLIPADGFYEWKRTGDAKQPYFVRLRGGAPFAFAGLWETWTGPNGEEMDTAAIVTTEANNTLRLIHDRMPVMLQPDAFDLWLDCERVDAKTATAAIAPIRDELVEAYPVSTAVNRVANDGPDLVQRVQAAAAESKAPVSAAPKPVRQAVPKARARSDEGQGSLF